MKCVYLIKFKELTALRRNSMWNRPNKSDSLQKSPLWQFILTLAHKSSWGNLEDNSSAGKVPGDWRTPRRFAYFRNHRVARSVLDCGGPPPLFPEACQTVPMLTGTAIVKLHRSCWLNGSFFLETNLPNKKATRFIIEWLYDKFNQISSSAGG